MYARLGAHPLTFLYNIPEACWTFGGASAMQKLETM